MRSVAQNCHFVQAVAPDLLSPLILSKMAARISPSVCLLFCAAILPCTMARSFQVGSVAWLHSFFRFAVWLIEYSLALPLCLCTCSQPHAPSSEPNPPATLQPSRAGYSPMLH